MGEMPYFMKKPEWYKFDVEKRRFILTDKAPANAVKSFLDFNGKLEARRNNGNIRN